MQPAEPVSLSALAPFAPEAIVSRVLAKTKGGSATLFAFAAGEELSEHTSAFDALAVVLEGEIAFTLEGVTHAASSGSAILLPGNVPHALHAPAPCRMLLILLK